MDNVIRFIGKNINYCPRCNTRLDGATPAHSDEQILPKAGDISMCLSCGVVLQFNEALELSPLKPEAIAELQATQPELLRDICVMINARRELVLKKGAKREGTH